MLFLRLFAIFLIENILGLVLSMLLSALLQGYHIDNSIILKDWLFTFLTRSLVNLPLLFIGFLILKATKRLSPITCIFTWLVAYWVYLTFISYITGNPIIEDIANFIHPTYGLLNRQILIGAIAGYLFAHSYSQPQPSSS